MQSFMVHVRPVNGALYPEDWQEVEAPNMSAAVIAALHLPSNKGLQPSEAWVSDPTGPHHANGAPAVAQKFALQWGEGVQHGAP